jgi:hypothetical protein
MKMPPDAIIFWVRSIGPKGKDRIPMYYKGRCDRRDEGKVGYDIKGRPVSLGPGEYTGTYGGSDFEYEDGRPIK